MFIVEINFNFSDCLSCVDFIVLVNKVVIVQVAFNSNTCFPILGLDCGLLHNLFQRCIAGLMCNWPSSNRI